MQHRARVSGWLIVVVVACALVACGDEGSGDEDVALDGAADAVGDGGAEVNEGPALAFEASGALTVDIPAAMWAVMQTHRARTEVPPDPTNAVADDPAAVALGHRLFFDPGLSANGEVACATCHDPAQGFEDGRALAVGLGQTTRHTPTLWNAAYQRWYFWDGRADSLWAQAVQPLEAAHEMGMSRVALAHQVAADPTLRAAYEALFGALPPLEDGARFPAAARPVVEDASDPLHQAWAAMRAEDRDAINRVLTNVTKALAAYERRLITHDAPFDRFLVGVEAGDEAAIGALTPEAQQGMVLFFGQAKCWLCHTGPSFSDREFHNLGLTPLPGQQIERGRTAGIDLLLDDPFNGLGAYSDAPDDAVNDKLRYLRRGGAHSDGAWKTPTLRELSSRAPYMHDGRFATLDEVVAFYDTVPGEPAIGHREDFMTPLDLSAAERAALVAFLRALDGEPVDATMLVAPD